MELNLRTVLVILGAIVMLGILIDGFRRMRRARQEALKLDVKGDFQFPEEGFSSELPNGGARIIGELSADELQEETETFRHQLDELPGITALDQMEDQATKALDEDIQLSLHEDRIYAGEPDFQHDSYEHSEQEPTSTLSDENDVAEDVPIGTADSSAEQAVSEQIVPKAKPLNLDEHVPLLMDVEELGEELAPQVNHPVEEIFVETDVITADEITADDHTQSVTNDASESNQEAVEGRVESGAESGVDEGSEEVIELGMQDIPAIEATVAGIADILNTEPEAAAVEETQDDGRLHAEEMMAQAAYAPVKKPGADAETLALRPIPSLVLVTHVIPHDDEGFCGEDILYLVNSCDLRHGEKEIFHRFEKENGEGCIQFSMANSFNPGTFNPETLLHERIHGVSLFMSLPGPAKAMNAFEAMTEMASVIARNLGGDVHDETHSIMALQTIEHNRQQVRDYVRKQKLLDKK